MVAIDISHSARKNRKAAALGQAPVVPQSVMGRMRRIKWKLLCLCLGVYYLTPFLRWDRGPGEPSQAVLLDFEHGFNRPRGLIDYESWLNIESGRTGASPQKAQLLRPKTIGLAAFCLVLAGGMSFVFATRSNGSLTVEHDRNPCFVVLSDGAIRNGYDVKIVNHGATSRAFSLGVEGLDGARLEILGAPADGKIDVPADGSQTVRVTLTSARENNATLRFLANDEGGHSYAAAEHFVAN